MQLKKKHWIMIIVGVLIVGAVVYGILGNKPKIEYTTASVTRGTLLQSVSETGTITPAKEIELNFTSSGQLNKLFVKIGDQVVVDQPLGEIDYSGLAIKQQEASANLAVSQANAAQAQTAYDSARREYDKLSASLSEVLKQAEKTRNDLEDHGPLTVTTYEQAVISAETSLTNTKSTYQRGIDNKNDSLNQTIQNKLGAAAASLEAMNRLFNDDDLKPTFSIKNSSALSSAKNSYSASVTLLAQANAAPTYDKAQSALNKTFEALNFTFSALENSIPNSNYTQAELDAAKANIDGQSTTTSTSITALQNAKQALDDAKLAYDTNVLSTQQAVTQAHVSYENAALSARNAVATARTNRDQQLSSSQTRIDTASGNLAVARAQVGQASANLALVQNQISDNTLKSPIKGIITKLNYEVGEQVTPQKALLSVLTENNYQIELDIAETDISKVKLNDSAEITLDALGPEKKFQGKVYFIEPAATIIQGVTYYKVKISFDPGAELGVKPGMTATAVLLTARRDNALIMPARAVVEQDGKTIVRILEKEVVREAPINVGLSGDNGMVEVISGVNENDQVVTFVKDPTKK